jgi:hypothetical protein
MTTSVVCSGSMSSTGAGGGHEKMVDTDLGRVVGGIADWPLSDYALHGRRGGDGLTQPVNS